MANATYQLNAAAAANYACTDGGSGSAQCQGPVSTGSLVDTSSVGTKTFTVSATDNVGNPSSLTVTYTVVQGGGGGSTSADLGITLSAPNKVSPKGTMTYVIQVNNGGRAAATGVAMSNVLPPGTVFASASTTQGTITAPAVDSNGTVALASGR